MAAVIMSASPLCLFLLGSLTLVSSQPSDGLMHPSSPMVSGIGAHVGFLRSKRANKYLLEEILQGDLERECYEERCTYEEAREYFEETTRTNDFWTIYFDGDQCKPNPCLHDGNCTDKVGGFSCTCITPHHGPTCELGAPEDLHGGPLYPTLPEMSECPTDGPTACHQLCTASYRSFTCSCMSGFKLQSDGRSCLPEVKFPCGSLPDTSLCRDGNCPWQVTLLNNRGVELCSGVVLGRRSVLTAAHCLVQDSKPDPQPSNFYVVPGNKKMRLPVRALYIHERFNPDKRDNDLALLELVSPMPFSPALIHLCLPTKDFSENILMHPGRMGVTKPWSQNQHLDQDLNLAYMTLDECRKNMNISYRLSNKMFCMMRQNEVLENENGALRNQGEVSNTQNRDLGSQNRALVNQNGASANTHRGLGNPNVVLGSQRQGDSLRIHNGSQRTQTRPSGNANWSRGLGETLENSTEAREIKQNQTQTLQNNIFRNQTGGQRRFQGHAVNSSQNQSLNQTPTESSGNSNIKNLGSSRLRDEVGSHGRPLPGSPVATVEQGTVFLTGLMISTDRNDDNGVVFTKLSRYLNWIKPRLEASENSMTSQVNIYPERR